MEPNEFNRIRQALTERTKTKGWSYIQLAKKAKVSEYAAYCMVKDPYGIGDVRLSTLSRLCKALDMKVEVAE